MDDKAFEQITRQAYKETVKEFGGGDIEDIDTTEEVEIEEPKRKRLPDMYRDREKARREESKKGVLRGCTPILKSNVIAVLSRLGPQFNQFKGAYDHFKEIGERGKANQLREQYQMENFLPALEAIVTSATPDEVLNSSWALDKMDEFSASGKGYTEAYLKQAYGNMLGQVTGKSDGLVMEAVNNIRVLGAKGMTRSAVAEAKNIKRLIDQGENIASEDDYALISRVANF